MADEFIPFKKKSQTQLITELFRLLQKIYVRLPINSEESNLIVKAMDILKDIV